MKRLRFSDPEIRQILSEQEGGKTVAQIAENHGISEATFYNWKARLKSGSDGVTSTRMRTLESENTILRNFCMDMILKSGNLAEFVKE